MDQRLVECRTSAAECRAKVNAARSEFERQQYLKMAEQWDLLACERQRTLDTQAKLRGM